MVLVFLVTSKEWILRQMLRLLSLRNVAASASVEGAGAKKGQKVGGFGLGLWCFWVSFQGVFRFGLGVLLVYNSFYL